MSVGTRDLIRLTHDGPRCHDLVEPSEQTQRDELLDVGARSAAVVAELATDAEVRVVVLRGAGRSLLRRRRHHRTERLPSTW